MGDSTLLNGCFAAGGLSAAQEVVAFMLRLLLAGFGLFLGWLVAGPVARGVYRVAFQRPIPPKVLTASRLTVAIAAAVLVFLLFPLGYGGGGGGRGGGKGPGEGAGADKGGTDSAGKGGKGSKDGKVKPPPGEPGETLNVEIITVARYKDDDKRFYLIEGKDPPLTLAEVDAYLKKHERRVKRINILVYADSFARTEEPAVALRDLAEGPPFRLPVYIPPEYSKQKKGQ
jgi:hypothetical protein